MRKILIEIATPLLTVLMIMIALVSIVTYSHVKLGIAIAIQNENTDD